MSFLPSFSETWLCEQCSYCYKRGGWGTLLLGAGMTLFTLVDTIGYPLCTHSSSPH